MKKKLDPYWISSAIYSFLQRFSLTFFGFINLIFLIRTLSKEHQMGIWAIFLTTTSIFEMTKTALLKNAHIKFVSGNMREKVEIASSSFLLNASVTLVFIGLIFLGGPWFSTHMHMGLELYNMLVWYIPAIVCMIFFAHLEAVQQSHLDFKGVFAGYFVRQTFFFLYLCACFFLHYHYSLRELVVFMSIGIFLGTITLYWYSRPYLHGRFIPTRTWVRHILDYGKYIIGGGVVSNIFINLDQFMSGVFLTPGAIASYNAALRINGFLDVPSYAASDIIFPKSAKASVEEGPGKVRYLFERMVGILLSFTWPIAVFIICFPRLVILVIGGRQYLDAAPILQMYMVAGIARPLQNQGANLLNSIGKPAITFWMNCIALGINLSINYLMIRWQGFYGAAEGTMISSIATMVIWYFLMKRQIGFDPRATLGYMLDTYRLVLARARQVLAH